MIIAVSLLATIRNTEAFNINVDAEVTGFEGLMKVFLSDTTSIDFSWLLVDAEITSDTTTGNYLEPRWCKWHSSIFRSS